MFIGNNIILIHLVARLQCLYDIYINLGTYILYIMILCYTCLCTVGFVMGFFGLKFIAERDEVSAAAECRRAIRSRYIRI